jgi:spore coat polysaccharide biosynthesis predicted glycosyltransferase SpsG
MIFIRVDGTNIQEIGMGHLYRMIDFSNDLYQKTGVSPVFVIAGYPDTKRMLEQSNCKYVEINVENEVPEILHLNSSIKKDILIIDMCDREESYIKKLLEKFIVISLDDTQGGPECSDIVFNSVVGSHLKKKNYYYGTDFFLIRPEISQYHLMDKVISDTVRNLLICFGGSDPCSVNLMMLDWLKELKYAGKVDWVLGPSVANKDLIIERFKELDFEINPMIDYKDMGKLYFHSDLCITAAGFSLYEAACVGLPALTICLYPHQSGTAKRFEENGCVVNLGSYKKLNANTFKSELYKLLNDKTLRYKKKKNGKALVDGMGKNRVLDIISEFF